MKPISQRVAEKLERERKERMRRSTGEKRYKSFSIPLYGYPYIETEGDILFLKMQAKKFVDTCVHFAPSQFLQLVKDAIHEKEENEITRRNTPPVPEVLLMSPTVSAYTEPTVAPLTEEQLNDLSELSDALRSNRSVPETPLPSSVLRATSNLGDYYTSAAIHYTAIG